MLNRFLVDVDTNSLAPGVDIFNDPDSLLADLVGVSTNSASITGFDKRFAALSSLDPQLQ